MEQDPRLAEASATTNPEAVVAMASEMCDRFGWPGAHDGFTVERTWVKTSSQNRFHLVVGVPDTARYVLKLETTEQGRDAQSTFDAMVQLADLLAEAPTGAQAIRPIGWLDSPSVIATPYVPGIDLVDILKAGTRNDRYDENAVLATVETVGAALATFHRSLTTDETGTPGATDSPRRLSRRLALPRSVAAVLQAEADRTGSGRKYGDFGPGNIRLADAGDIYILDPPTGTTGALVHRDIAYFSFQVHKNIAGYGTGGMRYPDQALRDRIDASFLTGYATGSDFDPRAETARALILAFAAGWTLGMARKRFRQRRWSDARWAIATAHALRGKAVQAARNV